MRLRTLSPLAALLAASAVAQLDPGENALDPVQAEQRGFDYWVGRGVARDPAEAAKWLEQAAAAGRPYAAGRLADLYRLGEGVPKDERRARELDARAAALGVAPAQVRLGYDAAYSQDPAARDPAASVPWLSAAAEQEHAPALFLLGQLYLFGQGVETDADLAWQLMTRAAELGFAPAQVPTGTRLLAGSPGRDDVRRGLHFLQTAASSRNGAAAYWLGKLYLAGRHVEKDFGLAAQWLTRSSELEFVPAHAWLAELYVKGLGVEVDAGRAAELRARSLPTMPVGARNEFAWELAVSPAEQLRNGPFAVEIMEGVTDERPTAAYLDTLAAAYAEAGRFEDAVRAQQRAVEALSDSASAAMSDSLRGRIELYRSRTPYREAP